MFGDIFNLLGQQGPDAWFQTATQLGLNIARGDDGDPNPQPAQRQRLEELAVLVSRHVDSLFGVAGDASFTGANRSALTVAALAQWKPLIEPLLASSNAPGALEDPDSAHDESTRRDHRTLVHRFQMGSVAGHFSERAWSLAVLPLPRLDATRLLVVNNLTSFAEAWSLDRDEVYVFALAQEFIAALVLSRPGTGDALRALLIDAVREAGAAQSNLLDRLQTMINPEDVNELMSNPESLLEGIEVPEDSRRHARHQRGGECVARVLRLRRAQHHRVDSRAPTPARRGLRASPLE